MNLLNITKIDLTVDGVLKVTPEENPSQMLRFTYRVDTAANWNLDENYFYCDSENSGSVEGVFMIIADASMSEFGLVLHTTENTKWVNINPESKLKIEQYMSESST